ncbi:MAG: acyl-CoA dehydrogenase [Sulfuricaulis sp.]|nr:acyl-CoA dehydrogenase [Sulfuricaulis sp.]
MQLTIDPDIEDMTTSLMRFIEREVIPIEEANKALLADDRSLFDATGRYVPEVLALRRKVRMRSAELGFYTLFGAADLGGSEMGARASTHIQETLYRRYGPARTLIQTVVLPSPFTNGLTPVLRALPPRTLARYREGIASGDKTLCFALSEPDAGSDVMAMKTRAVREGDAWVITGTKQWITNAPYADYAMVFAVTDAQQAAKRKGGITGFLVDMRTPGVAAPSVVRVMGHLGGETGTFTLDKVRVADDHRLGAVDQGLAVAIGGVSAGRLGLAAMSLGLAQWALDLALGYAKVRKTFGVPIAQHQAIQFMLADSAMDIYAAKAMLQKCSLRIDHQQDVVAEISMVKAFCTEMVGRVMDRCIQIHGGMGLTNELRLEEGMRLARQTRIPDGTGEIQRRTIALQMLAGKLDL